MVSLFLASGDVGVLFTVAVVEVVRVVAISSTFGTIFVQQTRNSLAVPLPTGPIIALHCVLECGFFLLLRDILIFNTHRCLANHELVFSKDQVLVVTTGLGLGDRVLGASEVNPALRIVKVR